MSDYETLQNMINVLPDTITNLNSGIDNLNTSIDGLTDERNAVEYTMTVMTTAASGWMDWKRDDLDPLYPDVTLTINTTGGWSESNLTGWNIWNSAGPSAVYTSSDVTSAYPASCGETRQYNRQLDFSEAYGHIHKVTDLNGTYGIAAKKASLIKGRGLQVKNRDKYKAVLKSYSRVLKEK